MTKPSSIAQPRRAGASRASKAVKRRASPASVREAELKALYDVPPEKGLRLLKEAGIVTPGNKLARLYR